LGTPAARHSGVATGLHKLFTACRPIGLFRQKDYQQSLVVAGLVADLT